MAKKYTPSGYTIIEFDSTNRTSGTAFTPETEDEKILYKILVSIKDNNYAKPILLHKKGGIYNNLSGFCSIGDNMVCLYIGDLGVMISETFILNSDGDKIVWTETEE